MSGLRSARRRSLAVPVVMVTLLLALSSLGALTAPASATSAKTPVLGMKGFPGPGATGWGTYKPKSFFNGGDPSGAVSHITWKDWGHRSATGTGRGYIFKPSGGYYPGTVKVALRAFGLGHCTAKSPLAYRHLDARYPARPGGKLGKWMAWGPSSSLCVTSSTSTPTTSTAAVPSCVNGQIAVSVGQDGDAGAGHEGQVLVFTNQSQSTCSLDGYPGVAGLDAQGNQVVQAQRTPSGYLGGLESGTTTSPVVPLAPGQVASATVEGTDVPVGNATTCPDYPALLVTPPNLTVSVQVAAGLPGCSQIEVHPVVPGTSGSES